MADSNFELPDDGFDWGAETCWSDWSVIKLIQN